MEIATGTHYNKPKISRDWKHSDDVLILLNSYGYECLKRSNLHCLERNTLAFVASYYVEVMDLKTRDVRFIRSTSSGSIGSIAVHPSRMFLAVAEKGTFPNIVIYDYPSLKACRLLRGGTEKSYSHVTFSPHGELLACVGRAPDYMLTIWDWKEESTLLMSRAYSQEVFNVSFSSLHDGVMISVGTGHIKFWKMSSTFTGLKLHGKVGKFQKKEISDIEGYCELPDGKVLTSCEWGNLLLWEGSLIKIELMRKNGKPCHKGPIQQIIFEGDRILTLGLDGYVRAWNFEIIDSADVTNETDLVEIEPINEILVGKNVQLKSVVRAPLSNEKEEGSDDDDDIWYAQDASGGIWKVDLSFSEPIKPPQLIFTCHSGPIAALCTSPTPDNPIVASIGVDCTIRIYDYDNDQLVCTSRFSQPGSALLWLPEVIDKKGSLLVAGFEDGIIRLLALKTNMKSNDPHSDGQSDLSNFPASSSCSHLTQFQGVGELKLVHVAKPHKDRVVSIDIDPQGSILATGSKDGTIFFFAIKDSADNDSEFLRPMGFVEVPSAVTFIKWSPRSHNRCTLLVCCERGHVILVDRLDQSQIANTGSYQLDGLKIQQYVVKTSGAKTEHKEATASFKEKYDDDDDGKSRMSSRMKAEPSSKSSDVLCGFHDSLEGKVWVSMSGSESGQLFEVNFLDDQNSPTIQSKAINLSLSSDDKAHPIKHIIYDERNRCFIIGRSDGMIGFRPMVDKNAKVPDSSHWYVGIHDSSLGQINSISISHDRKYLFSAGMDGNLFKFQYNLRAVEVKDEEEKLEDLSILGTNLGIELNLATSTDISDPKALCIEDAKKKAEYDSWMREAERKKSEKRKEIEEMRKEFAELKRLNEKMPESVRLYPEEFEMDPSIREDLARLNKSKLDKVKFEMNSDAEKCRLELVFDRYLKPLECDLITLKDFKGIHHVCSYRIAKLSTSFMTLKDELAKGQRSLQEGSHGMPDDISSASGKTIGADKNNFLEIPKVKVNIEGSKGEILTKALNKVREIKLRRNERALQWKKLMDEKCDPDKNDPKDDWMIEEAKRNIGDYKLKTSEDYLVPKHLRTTTFIALGRIISMCEMIHGLKVNFNEKLLNLRKKKIIIITTIEEHVEMLKSIIKTLNTVHHNCDKNKNIADNQETVDQSGKGIYKNDSTNQITVDNDPNIETNVTDKKNDVKLTFEKELEDVFNIPSLEPCEIPERKFQTEEYLNKNVQPNDEQASGENIWTDKNEFEILFVKKEMMKLSYKKNEIVNDVRKLKKFFDAELLLLRNAKFAMDVELVNAELRLIMLLQELDVVKEFEEREEMLIEILEGRLNEKKQMQRKITVLKQKLKSNKKETETLQTNTKELVEEFKKEFFGHEFADFLTKVFKMKARKPKLKPLKDYDGLSSTSKQPDEQRSSSSPSSSSSSSDLSSDSDSIFAGNKSFSLDPKVCPPGCSQDDYNKACNLRERRINMKGALAENRLDKDNHQKDLAELKEKFGVIEVLTKSATEDLESYQKEKQKKLNEIDVIVTLTCLQIEALNKDGTLIKDLSLTVVMPKSEIFKLKNKTIELRKENEDIKKLQIESKKKSKSLSKENKSMIKLIELTKKECNDMIDGKFGRMVDLEVLEQITINPSVEAAKHQLNSSGNVYLLEIEAIERKIKKRKSILAKYKRENSFLLDQFNETCKYTLELEKLPSIQDSELEKQKLINLSRMDENEIKRLKKIVRDQSKEIIDAKREILMLSLKTGHVNQKI